MEDLITYIFSPSTLISLISSLIAFISAYKGMEFRIKMLEEKQKELDTLDIKTKIIEIQKDLQYLREMYDKSVK